MLKRKEFILGAAVGLSFAAVATAGGVIQWPGAEAQTIPALANGRLIPSAGAAGAAFQPPPGAPLSFADIFDQVSPAVVQIDVKTRIATPRGGVFQIPGLPFGFQVPPGAQGPEGEEGEDGEGPTSQGAGSGFFISADGFIVTNNHVVADATEITVKLSDERELKATLVGRDEGTDLAVIKVEGADFPFVSFEQSAEPRVGDWVIAVGNPFGLGGTATAGIVSAKARDIDPQGYNDFIQIDAAINRGNSGGPTFDIYGRVIGVNSAIFSPTGGSVGIGFAIPAAVAKNITDQLMQGEAIERGYLGIEIQTLDANVRGALGLAEDTEGAYIGGVTPDGPADKAGLEIDDVVVAVNGTAVDSSTELTRLVGATKPGDRLRLDILRATRRQTVNVQATRRPSRAELDASRSGAGGSVGSDELETTGVEVEGIRVSPLSAAVRGQFGLPDDQQGVVVTAITPGSNAADLGLQPGLVILRANSRPVASAAELKTAIDAARAAGRPGVILLVRTPGGNRSVVLDLDQPSGN